MPYAARRISYRQDLCGAVPLTGSSSVVPMIRFRNQAFGGSSWDLTLNNDPPPDTHPRRKRDRDLDLDR